MLLGTNPLLLSQKSLLNAFLFQSLKGKWTQRKIFLLGGWGFGANLSEPTLCGRNVPVPVKNSGKISQLKDKISV